MKKYNDLVQKFLDKGYIEELHWFVIPTLPFTPGKLIANSIEEELEKYNRIVEEIYGKEWDYWNAWIDTQLPK
jgi:hypothetical protein